VISGGIPGRSRLALVAIGLALALAGAAREGRTQEPEDAELRPAPPLPSAGSVAIPPANIDRDPFRPFTLDLKPLTAAPPKTPLEQYDVGSLKLVAVIWNTQHPRAMVEDASGLGYTIDVGTPIGRNQGVVKRIEPDAVIVEEEFVDFYGEQKKNDVVLKLETEGEKKP
jgi:hypothetical protein